MDPRLSAAAEWLRERLPHPPLVGVILGSGLGDFADGVDEARRRSLREDPGLPGLGRGRPRGSARRGQGPRRSDRRPVGPRALLRGPPDGVRGLPGARPRPPRLPHGDRDERRGRHRHVVQVRQPHAHRGPHQRVRHEPARRRERGGPRAALPRHVRRVPQGSPRDRARGREEGARRPEEGRLRRASTARRTRRRRRSARSGAGARTPSGCPRSPRSSR